MKRSGKTNRVEPSDMSWVQYFPDYARLFSEARWLKYFEKIHGHQTKVSDKFAQGLDKDIVTFDTLKIELTGELIAEATGIPDEGEYWFKKVPFTFDSQNYLLPNVVADWGKGVHIQKFKPEWREPIKIMQSYVTCEGRYAFVFKYHFRFLQHLNHEAKMNLPFFFLKSLQKMSNKVKEHQDHTK